MEVMNESKDEDRSRSASPPSLCSLSLAVKAPKKSLGLTLLTPTLTTSPASPQRDHESQAATSPKSPGKSPKSPRSPIDISKASPLRSLPKLATLSKPPGFNANMFRNRTARHSIDVRNMPSYLAKKRQSTFGQFLSGTH